MPATSAGMTARMPARFAPIVGKCSVANRAAVSCITSKRTASPYHGGANKNAGDARAHSKTMVDPTMVNPMVVNLLGFAASLAVLATFLMRTMAPLRAVAIGSNILFIAYGYCAHLPPVLCLHIALLPINVARLSGARKRFFILRPRLTRFRRSLANVPLLSFLLKPNTETF
jgi:hypothetical protein